MAKSLNDKYFRKGYWFPKHAQWMTSPAYRDLKPIVRCLLDEFLLINRPGRNGKLSISVLNAVELLRCAPDTASRAFHSLAEHGFIALTKGEYWQEKKAREWRLTIMPCNGCEPTDEWIKWDKEKPIVKLPRKNKPRS